MAIKLIANYSKRLGLPGYSSHQFSVSLETELVTTDDVTGETERLYHLLQTNVDGQMKTSIGFVPPKDYGFDPPAESKGQAPDGTPAPSAPANITHWQQGPAWKCSDKQRDLILKLVDEHHLDKNQVESLAVERFGKGVKILNKVEASGLIDELLDTHGQGNSQAQGKRGTGSAYKGANGRRAA